MASNGNAVPSRSLKSQSLQRAEEADDLLSAVKALVIPFIRAADEDALTKHSGHGLQQPGSGPRTVLLEHHAPKKLISLLDLQLPDQGLGREGLLASVQNVLKYSVNTWDQGFLDKLYASTTPVGLAADLLLSSLNTNLHVYQVSPALTVIEKQTAKALANLFGFKGTYAGGISQPGGSAANQSSMVIARNVLHPDTKTKGYEGKRFVLFTSAHGHYSVEKAAQMFGFGSEAVKGVPVDDKGCMKPDALESMIEASKKAGETPFYVNATVGTTVLGSYDPLDAIADVCQRHKLWLHADGSWGSPVIFSAKHKHKVAGIARADSIALCPHKMMGVPLTCSFLLCKDMRQCHKAMTLPAGYLFHEDGDDESAVDTTSSEAQSHQDDHSDREIWDLADLTPQCGRRGDSLKLALAWTYHGSAGFESYIDTGFEAAAHLAALVDSSESFTLVSENPPPCLQVCFYYSKQKDSSKNSQTTEKISQALIPRGFMIDYAPGAEGKFFRVVVNGQTRKETVEGLVKAIEEVGTNIAAK